MLHYGRRDRQTKRLETRPALGPKGLIVSKTVRAIPLFSQARLGICILLLKVRFAPARDIMRTVRYGIVPTLRRYSQNLR